MAVTERDDVLVARIVPASAAASRRRNASRLRSRSSGMASITNPVAARSATDPDSVIRASAASASPAWSWPFATLRSRKPPIRSRARSYAPETGSSSATSSPASAATWAIPAPIVPAPRTPIRVISVNGSAEPRIPLLGERGEALGVVIGPPGRVLERGLVRHAGGQIGLLGLVDGSLGQADGRRWRRCEATGDLPHAVRKLGRAEYPVDEPAVAASAADIGSPKNISSAARCRPRVRTRVRVDPESGTRPIFTNARMKRASSLA